MMTLLTPQQLLRTRADGETVLADAPETPQTHILSILIENLALRAVRPACDGPECE